MEFVELKSFEIEFKKAGLTDSDMRKMQSEILNNPDAGDIEEGVKGLRKLRIPSVNGKGKSGGARLHYIIIGDICYFISFIPKNVAENLTKSERNEIAKFIKDLKNVKESFHSDRRNIMGNKTYYDYIKDGLQELQEYLNGDKSKGKECTIIEKELSFSESKKNGMKLQIREIDDK